MSKIFFLPYVGQNYEKGFKKVLIIDTIHYCDENCEVEDCPSGCENKEISKWTIKIIENTKERNDYSYANIFINFEKAMCGGVFQNKQDQIEFWDSLAFYHYCQKPMTHSCKKPGYLILNESFDAFVEVVDKYKPDIIISLGKYVENILAAKLGHSEKYRIDESVIYTFNNKGNEILLFPIHHPSFDFSWKNYHKVIDKVFNLEK